MTARMEYKPNGAEIVARWHGGAYIDIYSTAAELAGAPFACVNVWNYATDTPTIPATLAGLTAAVDSWVAEHYAAE